MKLSVSTRIFLGFALVIIAFVSAYTYTLIQSKALRESFMVTWQGIAPIATELKELSRGVREPQEFLELRRPSDAHYLHQFLPRPFERFRDVESKLRTLVELSDVVASDRRRLVKAADRLKGFRLGSELKEAIGVDNLTQELSEQPTNEDFFKQLIRGTIKAANEGRLTNRSLQARATIKALRRIDVVVNDARKELQKSLRDLPDRARQEARAATTWMVLIAAGALLLSLLILVWSHLILRPIRELHEGARRIAAGHYDETVRVRSADEIGQLAAEFNTMATALRMRDEKLARQRVELLRADRLATIGKLAAQITHEVRNPLLSIGLNAELLEEDISELPGATEARDLIGAIGEEVQRLKGITEEYLCFARLPRPNLEQVDMSRLLQDIMDFVSHECSAADITLELDFDSAIPVMIQADAGQLRQAFLNIVRNALEAMAEVTPPRCLRVSLSTYGHFVSAIFADNGPGVDPSLSDRVFEPFVTGKSGGTGLGLALTHQIIHEHLGEITIERSPEFGETIVKVLLPVKEDSV